jgi:putative transposase
MPFPLRYHAFFEAGGYFHVIVKSLNNNLLFLSAENKRYFLQKYSAYLADYVNTYCYCLLDNHVHLLVRVKAMEEIIEVLSTKDKLNIVAKKFIANPSPISLNALLERQFNSFFVSYTMSLNKISGRKGHLFDSPFKRIALNSDEHLTQLIIYIHANAMKHRITNDFSQYKWSSYLPLTSGDYGFLDAAAVFQWFGGKDAFMEAHAIQANHFYEFEE